MNQLPKRYIFVDYNSLKTVKFSTLEKVCNKVFILISDQEKHIPAHLVMQAQHLGKRVKWIASNINEDNGFMFHIAFLIGALHQKANPKIEFAILSDDSNFDSLVHFINDNGRNCLRVKTKNDTITEIDEDYLDGILIEDELIEDDFNEDGEASIDINDKRFIPEPLNKFKIN